ncbi:hypothetical protein ACJX0J_035796, partial [Zea mays]
HVEKRKGIYIVSNYTPVFSFTHFSCTLEFIRITSKIYEFSSKLTHYIFDHETVGFTPHGMQKFRFLYCGYVVHESYNSIYNPQIELIYSFINSFVDVLCFEGVENWWHATNGIALCISFHLDGMMAMVDLFGKAAIREMTSSNVSYFFWPHDS